MDEEAKKLVDAEIDKMEAEEAKKLEQENLKKAEEVEEKIEEDEKEEVETEEETDDKSEEDKSEEDKPSRREQLRIHKLLEKYGNPDERQQEKRKDEGPNFKDIVDADEQALKDLETETKRYGEAQYQSGLDQARSIQFHTRLEIDAPRVMTKYPFMDKDSKDFDSDYADAMNMKYLQFVGYDGKTDTVRNPQIRYADFVEAEVEFANRLAEQKISKTRNNINKQAANTGIRPGGSTAKKLDLNKLPHQMTDEELQAKIKQDLGAVGY